MSVLDAVILLGFGGPESPQEIRPFLDHVLRGRPVSRERYETVVDHYLKIGGRSPFNELTQGQASKLELALRKRGVVVPVLAAFLNSPPFARELAAQVHDKRVAAVILAAHQSPASWDKYRGLIPNARYIEPYYDDPRFIAANAEHVRDALQRLGAETFDDVALVFTAHSIPVSMANPYATQFARTAQLVAQTVGAKAHTIAYQSRSGAPADPWLEPDVRDALRELADNGAKAAVVAPIGFLCDHVEVLYDLDVDAAQVARELGMRMERAATLGDHPAFIEMLADRVLTCFE